MEVAGGVRRHVASKANSGDNPRWRLIIFFSGKARPWNFGTCFGELEFEIDEHPDYLLYSPIMSPVINIRIVLWLNPARTSIF